jgi:hypothetical protein
MLGEERKRDKKWMKLGKHLFKLFQNLGPQIRLPPFANFTSPAGEG